MKKTIAQEIARAALPPKRFAHSIGVAEMAEQLAKCWGVDAHQAYLAGMLHDLAKGLPYEQQLTLAQQATPKMDAAFLKLSALWHGPATTVLLQQQGVQDAPLLEAIYYHTVAKPQLSLLGQILYIADCLEPGRDFAGIEELRKLATQNLSQTMAGCLKDTISYLQAGKREIHPLALEALAYYEKQAATDK